MHVPTGMGKTVMAMLGDSGEEEAVWKLVARAATLGKRNENAR